MSKYKPLADFLGGHDADSWRATFDELENSLGLKLPKAARESPGWWNNDVPEPKPHARAWLDTGWRAAADLTGGHVTFTRKAAAAARPEADPTAHQVMAAAEAEYEKSRAAETAKKVGAVAAVVGVVAAGVGLFAARLMGRKK